MSEQRVPIYMQGTDGQWYQIGYVTQEFIDDTPPLDLDPDIIRGIERVTGEKYEDGQWRRPYDS